MNRKYAIWGIIALLALWVLSGINTLPRLDESVKTQWSQVQIQYQRRADLIPNLVRTVKGYATHENATLKEVTEARANATKITVDASILNDPEAFKKMEAAQSQLSMALGKLLAVSENYPNLKADQNFLSLQSQLEGTENRISVARRDYSMAVQQYNIYVRTFPGFIYATIYGAKRMENFSATTPGADKAPEVNF